MNFIIALTTSAVLVATGISGPALAETPAAVDPGLFKPSLQLKLDAVGVVAGGERRGLRHVDTLDLGADVDLERAFGWKTTAAHIEVVANGGDTPNALADTLQGVNNAEVSSRRVRLYQAWIETSAGPLNLRAGYSDLNTEFDMAAAAGLLMGSSFGMGGELAATGMAGPSLYPSTALGLRLRLNASPRLSAQGAVVNADSGTPGDLGAPNLSRPSRAFRDGVLAIAEIDWTVSDAGHATLALGGWRYSRAREPVRADDPGGLLAGGSSSVSQGLYGVVEARVMHGGAGRPAITAFLKAGASEGRTTDIKASWQAGLLAQPVFASRPDSQLSVGMAQALLSRGGRDNRRDEGMNAGPAETQLEITYSDTVAPHLALQPGLQLVWNHDGDRGAPVAVVMSLRLTLAI